MQCTVNHGCLRVPVFQSPFPSLYFYETFQISHHKHLYLEKQKLWINRYFPFPSPSEPSGSLCTAQDCCVFPCWTPTVTPGCRSVLILCFRSLCQLCKLVQDKGLISYLSTLPLLILLSEAISQNLSDLLPLWAVRLGVSSANALSPITQTACRLPAHHLQFWPKCHFSGRPSLTRLFIVAHLPSILSPFPASFLPMTLDRSPSNMLCMYVYFLIIYILTHVCKL